MTFFTITILSRSVPSRLVPSRPSRPVPSVHSRGAKIRVGGLGEWKGTRPRKQGGGRRAGEEDNQNLFYLSFFSPLPFRLFIPIYDDYDMMHFLAFSFFYTVEGARRFVWFGLGGVG